MRNAGRFVAVFSICILAFNSNSAAELEVISGVAKQPLTAATKRLADALKLTGAPLSADEIKRLEQAYQNADVDKATAEIQKVLDAHCLASVNINAESRVSVTEGPAKPRLVEQGWETFLIKVHNEAGVTAPLKVRSPQAAPVYLRGRGARQKLLSGQPLVKPADIEQRFLDLAFYEKQPLKPTLSGLEVEYRILQVFSRDQGKREAKLEFDVGQGTQDLGFRNTISILFDCAAAIPVKITVTDFDGEATTAAFIIRDSQGKVYPNPSRRLAPDLFFHNQIYRQSGEHVRLPAGEYTVSCSRGPEYVHQQKPLIIKESEKTAGVSFKLKRWVHPAKLQWFSGDHHVHAAGCKHYDTPSEGVLPEDMLRHIIGEDLNVGCVLTWGPCWYYQKQFFEGETSPLSKPDYLMRYDVEVSGFPSSHAGHLCLLRLKEDDYPGTTQIEEWPSWTMPVLQWGQKQGAVVGYSHSGWGLALPDYGPRGERVANRKGKAADKLPDYAMPPFDGIGANEYIVTVAHDACDFISAVDTPSVWELNIWYHTLNCGYRAKISGETDFPCIYGDKVGLGRIYVKMPKDEPLDFNKWAQGLKDGRSYCGDGLSHIIDFRAGDVALGEPGTSGKLSQLDLKEPGKVKVEFDVAALLEEMISDETERIRSARLDAKPYWHIERSRIGDSRKVPVELIMNGKPVARQEITADGSMQSIEWDVKVEDSSWLAVRIFPSVHTNPIFVEVAGKPIRASKKSAQWCRKAVDVCWNSKKGRIRDEDQKAAVAAYEAAREKYDVLIEESRGE